MQYRRIFCGSKSPLETIAAEQSSALQSKLPNGMQVFHASRYGRPGVGETLGRIESGAPRVYPFVSFFADGAQQDCRTNEKRPNSMVSRSLRWHRRRVDRRTHSRSYPRHTVAEDARQTPAGALVAWVCDVLLSDYSVKAYGRDLAPLLSCTGCGRPSLAWPTSVLQRPVRRFSD